MAVMIFPLLTFAGLQCKVSARMALQIPTVEPTQIYVGDTVQWTRTLVDFSAADGWVLHYSFRRQGGEGSQIDIASTASGALHLLSIDAATTAQWLFGNYRGEAYVELSGEVHTVWRGDLEILADLASKDSTFDTRTKAERILDFIDRSFERVAQKQVVQSNIEGVNLQFRSIDDLIKARNYWQQIVNAERMASSGSTRSNQILARFTRPT